MSVVDTDIKLRFSVAAAAGNTTAGTGATSLGDQISTTDLTSNALHDLFDVVPASEATAGRVEYRCIFVLNDHATDPASNVKVEVASQVSGGATFDLALDNIGVTTKGSASPQAATVANETTSPGASAGSFGAGPLTIGSVAAQTCAGVWVRRTVTAGATANVADGGVLRTTGEG